MRTTLFGADYAAGPKAARLSLSHSRGLGEYAGVTCGQAWAVTDDTSEGSAQASVDYAAASGRLTFQAGKSSAKFEGGETLTLSNASGGRLTDSEADRDDQGRTRTTTRGNERWWKQAIMRLQ